MTLFQIRLFREIYGKMTDKPEFYIYYFHGHTTLTGGCWYTCEVWTMYGALFHHFSILVGIHSGKKALYLVAMPYFHICICFFDETKIFHIPALILTILRTFNCVRWGRGRFTHTFYPFSTFLFFSHDSISAADAYIYILWQLLHIARLGMSIKRSAT